MTALLAAWEEALWAAIGEPGQGPGREIDAKALTAAIVERSRRYTSERDRLAIPVPARESARDLAARALFFGLADAAKIAVPLAELAGRGLVPVSDPLRVLDVGAGTGGMTIGVAAALARSLEVVAIDRDARALAVFRDAVARGPTPIRLSTIAGDVRSTLPQGAAFDLVVAGSLLNELVDARARVALVTELLQRLAPGGALVILEPALRETARALHRVRDALLEAGLAFVFAPCTRAGAPCPALADGSDWCHEDRPFAAPPRLEALARATGLRTRGMKFAYLTLRLDPAPLVPVAPGRRALRVVSDALDQKGFRERIVCSDAGRDRLRLLKREASDRLRTLAGSERGDVLLTDESGDLELVKPSG